MRVGELLQKSRLSVPVPVPVPVPAPVTMASTVPAVFLNHAAPLKAQAESRRLPPRKPLFSKCARDRSSSKEFSRAMKPEFKFLEVGNGGYYVHRVADTLNKVIEPGPTLDAMKPEIQDGVRRLTEVRKLLHGKSLHCKNYQIPRAPCKPRKGSLGIQKVACEKEPFHALQSGAPQIRCLRGTEILRKPNDVPKLSGKDDDDGWPTLNQKLADTVLPSLRDELTSSSTLSSCLDCTPSALVSGRKKPAGVGDQDDSQKSSEKDAESELQETTDDTARQEMTSLSVGSPTGSNASSSSTMSFHYSNYRYAVQHPPEEPGRRVRALDAVYSGLKERSHVSNTVTDVPGGQMQMSSPVAPWKAPPLIGLTSKVLPYKTMPEEFEQMGEVLCRLYGADTKDLVWSYNTISIPFESITTQQNPNSPRPGEPTLWLRGGRVYDYIGDLGTYAEFIEETNPWRTNRNHRRNSGYQPFPFLPQPPGERSEDGVNLRYQDELKKWTQIKLIVR